MRELLLTLAIVSVVLLEGAIGRRFGKCELATILKTKYHMPKNVANGWVCIAEYESSFNTQAINHNNGDGSSDYGLFQIKDKYWCDSHYEQNLCHIPCSALLDDNLDDDIACVKTIIKETESWKGIGTGLTAWVAYVRNCQNRDLDQYMSECGTNRNTDNFWNRPTFGGFP